MGAARTLLTGLVDYAGLFPPATLAMAAAVAAYASYARGRHGWMLGRFVVPVARLDEFEERAHTFLPTDAGGGPWRLAAIAGPDVSADGLRVRAFNQRHAENPCGGGAVIDSVEVRASSAEAIASVAGALPHDLRVAYELPLDRTLAATVAAVGTVRGIAKARLGGTMPEAFPTTESVAAWLWHAAVARVPIKATAGLHHAFRAEHRITDDGGSARIVMHGFVNVFAGAAFAYARAEGAGPGAEAPRGLEAVLAETDPDAFRCADDGLRWRDVRLETQLIARCRAEFALSFGSCSFEEPADELRALGWLSD